MRELLRLDVDYRRRRGESPGADDYAACCPGDAEAIRSVLAEVSTDPPRGEQLSTDPNRTTPEAPRPTTGEPPYPTIPGYEVFGRLGQGGMGEVVRGHDLHMGRDLAVKVLLERYRDMPELVQRFLTEGRIQGRLQHPGIVPVHELGELPDRRPYFTMKLVQGCTLAELLQERADPTQDLPNFLTIFQQVCQAVAYAHKNGVIHRDLKPQNVMVGAFGEVQVMDWGLAKRMAQSPERERGEPTARPAGGAGAEDRGVSDGDAGLETQPGAILGTYAYMAPEQARGEVEALDERCDVFGLGALLCEILTGRPPLKGVGRHDLLRRAQTCDHAEALAALDASGADAELVRLTKDCLAAEASARPADAGAVAAALTAYLAGVQERLRRAELARAAAEARAKEERRRRRAQLGMAAAVLVLAAVGTGGGLWIREQAAARRQVVASTVDKVKELRDQMRFREAEAVLKQGQAALGDSGPDDLRRQLRVVEDELALVNRLDAIRQRLATSIDGHFDYRTAALDYAAAFKDAGLGEVGDDEEAVAARVRASGVAAALVAALDHWAAATEGPDSRAWLLGVARRAGPDPWGDRFRDPQVWRDRQMLQALADEALRDGGAKLEKLSPQILATLGALLRGGAGAAPLLRAAQRRYPNDFWLCLQLGNALAETKQFDEAVGYFRVAVALRPDAAAAHDNLAGALASKGDLEGAIAECWTALALDPKDAGAHTNLGIVLRHKGDVEGGIAEFRTAIDLDPRGAVSHYNLGVALRDEKKDVEGALAAFRQAIDCDPNYAPAHCNLGVALHTKGDPDGAIAAFRTTIALDPQNALAHANVGIARYTKGDLEGAMAAFRQAIALDPSLALAHYSLGVALSDKKDVDGAIAAFQKAIDCDPKDVRAHTNLGNALHDKGDLDRAIAEFRAAIVLDPKDALAHYNLGIALHDRKDEEEAIAEYHKAIELNSNLAKLHNNLGDALCAKGDLEGAIAAFRRAIELDPKYTRAYHNLGIALRNKGDLDGAVTAYQKAIALDPKLATAHDSLGVALGDKGDLDGAVAAHRRAIALDPKLAATHYNLGSALHARGNVDEAIAAYQKAIALEPKLAYAHGALGAALLRQGHFADARTATRRSLDLLPGSDPLRQRVYQQLRQAERLAAVDEKLPAVLAWQAEPADAAERLALAQLCGQYKRRHVAAARFYADAFATDPKLAADLRQQHRYNAACSAALAAAGQAEDAQHLPDTVRLMLRRQSLAWLRDDLAAYRKLAERAEPAAKQAMRQQLRHWQQDADLASLRDPQALAQLPEDERQSWRHLWDDVAALLGKLGAAP